EVVSAVLHHVADERFGQTASERLERGKRVDDVAHGAEPDEQDPGRVRRHGHRRFRGARRHAGLDLRMLIGAISGRRQLPRRMTKVSANACCPDRQAWLTRSVKTIQAWNGLNRNSWWPSAVDWNVGVSCM